MPLLLELAEGPIFRCAFALLVLGVLRAGLLAGSDAMAAYLTTPPQLRRSIFWPKVRERLLWFLLPAASATARPLLRSGGHAFFAYHLALSAVSLLFRTGVVVVPTFMVAHVYLWERGLGLSWPAFPGPLADVLALVTVVSGVVVFLGQVYSPIRRRLEPAWSFLKPLLLVLPFASGFLAMHPTWSPLSYQMVRLIHVLSASLVFVLVPFTRLLSGVHTPLLRPRPELAWDATALRAPAVPV